MKKSQTLIVVQIKQKIIDQPSWKMTDGGGAGEGKGGGGGDKIPNQQKKSSDAMPGECQPDN